MIKDGYNMQNKTIFQQTAMWAALLTLTACAAPHVAQPQLTVVATGKVITAGAANWPFGSVGRQLIILAVNMPTRVS